MGLIDGRVAVVTGSGRGIGRAAVLTFVREGAACVINDVDSGPAEETLAMVGEIGGRAVVCCGSVADPTFTDELMACAAENFGGLDILVNNAGITRDKVIHKMSDADWDFVIDVSLRGTFNCIRSSSPYIREASKKEVAERGDVDYHRKIVNFFSTAAIRGNPGQANYTAAKMGVVGLTRTIAQEWGRFRVNVNAVGPGFTDTRLTKPRDEMEAAGCEEIGIPSKFRDAMIERCPFGRPAEPQDIANVILFFSSPLSDYVTGQEINVSGGYQIP